MTSIAVIPTHQVATWLITHIRLVLNAIGLKNYPNVETFIYILVVVALAYAIGWIIKFLIITILRKFTPLHNSSTGRDLLDRHVLTKCGLIIPPLVILTLIPYAFAGESTTATVLERIVIIYLLITLGVAVSAVFSFFFYRYDARENTRNLPLKGILNIAIGIVWLIIAIIGLSVLIHRSPIALLTGLGAFAAALMLIFKDSILGFVAGVQMSQNDMLHVGDWIVVPGTPANGNVIDVSLTAVKVQNFDNTIVTVPPYTLVSTSFQNYVGMYGSNIRRFVRVMTIVPDSVTECTDAMISAVTAKYPKLKDFVDKLKAAGTTQQNDPGLTPINGTIETNLGLFRAYTCIYLADCPYISHKDNILVNLSDPTPEGLRLQIYAFTTTTEWATYEGMLSAVMEHLNVAIRDFGLRIYTRADLSVSQIAEA